MKTNTDYVKWARGIISTAPEDRACMVAEDPSVLDVCGLALDQLEAEVRELRGAIEDAFNCISIGAIDSDIERSAVIERLRRRLQVGPRQIEAELDALRRVEAENLHMEREQHVLQDEHRWCIGDASNGVVGWGLTMVEALAMYDEATKEQR